MIEIINLLNNCGSVVKRPLGFACVIHCYMFGIFKCE